MANSIMGYKRLQQIKQVLMVLWLFDIAFATIYFCTLLAWAGEVAGVITGLTISVIILWVIHLPGNKKVS